MPYLNVSTNSQTAPNIQKFQSLGFYCFTLLVAILALLPRLDSYNYYFGKYLWAEDGIFLNEASKNGLIVIIKPYAGYLLLYPRVITTLSQLLDFLYQPTVLLLGWLLAYFILMLSIARSLLQESGSIIFLTPLIALVSLQPHYGEVFFNITNSQWMLGAALFLYTLTDSNQKQRPNNQWGQSLCVLPLTLTGPFSIILTPVLIFKIILKKDWCKYRYLYLTVFFGASIQLIYCLSSKRLSSGLINQEPWEWIVAFLKISSFGANNFLTVFAALIIWTLIGYLIFSTASKNSSLHSAQETSILLLISAFLLIIAGEFACKEAPMAITALGGGNRYTWIPYTLIITAAILLSSRKTFIAAIIIALFSFIFWSNFHKINLPNLQFEAFAKFSHFDKVIIPISPQWPMFPKWHITKGPQQALDRPNRTEMQLTPKNIHTSGLNQNFSKGHLNLVSISNDPILIFNNKICPKHFHTAINIYLTREKEGWMQVFWSENNQGFNERASLRRWYPSGDIKAQFAFRSFPKGTYLRLDPMEIEGVASIKKIELYCL